MKNLKVTIAPCDFLYETSLLVTVSDLTDAQVEKVFDVFWQRFRDETKRWEGCPFSGFLMSKEEGWASALFDGFSAYIEGRVLTLTWPLLSSIHNPDRLIDLGLEVGEVNEKIELEHAFLRVLEAVKPVLRPVLMAGE